MGNGIAIFKMTFFIVLSFIQIIKIIIYRRFIMRYSMNSYFDLDENQVQLFFEVIAEIRKEIKTFDKQKKIDYTKNIFFRNLVDKIADL